MNLRALFILLFVGLSVIGCSSLDKYDTSTAEGAFNLAARYAEDERYEEAIAQFTTVKNKFPYSKLATEAELRIADIQYERESYIEAQTAYEVFKELHPRHPKSDYVTFRLGMSLFNQLPSTIDRDLTLAQRAIMYFQEVERSYPTSEHVAAAKEHQIKSREMLAEKELYVGDFYLIRDMHESALSRYESMIKNYPEAKAVPRALAAASRASLALEDKRRAVFYYNQLKERFPQSPELSTLNSEMENELSAE